MIPRSAPVDTASNPERFSIRNLLQIGGVYHQVIPVAGFLLAARTGGLQAFAVRDGFLHPMAELPLAAIPTLEPQADGTVLCRFRSRVLTVRLDPDGIHTMSVPSPAIRPPRPPARSVVVGGRTLVLPAGAGAGVDVFVGEVRVRHHRLPGYSRPTSLAMSPDGATVWVADVGAIHQVAISAADERVAHGYAEPGWPKAAVLDGDSVFVADVYGVRWYRLESGQSRLTPLSRFGGPRFRVARLAARNGRILACDEARGVHFLRAEGGRLVPRGGLMLAGGAWGISVEDGRLLAACGNGGWIEAAFDWDALAAGPVRSHSCPHEVRAVVPWAGDVALATSSGLLRPGREPLLQGASCWAAAPAGRFLMVAADRAGVFSMDHAGNVVGHVPTVEARDLALDGHRVWVADGRGGVRCLTIDERGALAYVGVFPVAGFCRGLACSNDRVLVGAGDGGLVVLGRTEGARD